MSTTIDKDKVGKAIGKVAGGLYIVNAKADDHEAGFLASWIQQAGFEPPMLTVAIKKDRYHLELIKDPNGGKFTVNVMGKANSKAMSAFFKAPPEGQSAYDGLETFTDKTGVKILKDSVAYLECEYRGELETGDHVVISGEIVGGDLLSPDLEPSVHYRPDGFKY